MPNQDPEQIARDNIDRQLIACGWVIQDKEKINLNAGLGVVVRYYPTQDGKETDYAMFVDKKPVGVIEAKREEEGHRLTVHESQSEEYAASKLKYLNNAPLPFVYESTGDITRFTDFRAPKPCSRPVFTFHRPETFRLWLKKPKSLRSSLLDLPTLPAQGLRDCQIRRNSYQEIKTRREQENSIDIVLGKGRIVVDTPDNLIVNELINFSEVDYDEQADLLFKLATQAIEKFQSYLAADDVMNVVQYHKQEIGRYIYSQLMEHFYCESPGF